MIYSIPVTVSANTLESNAEKTTIKLTSGIITRVGILIPAGHCGLTGCRIHRALHQVFPSINGQYFTGDDVYITWDEYLPVLFAPFDFDIYCWNTDDTYDHTFQFHIVLRSDILGVGTGFYQPITEAGGGSVPYIPKVPETPEVPEVPETPEVPPEKIPPPEEELPPPEEILPPEEPEGPETPEVPEIQPTTVSILLGFGFTKEELQDLRPWKVVWLCLKYFDSISSELTIYGEEGIKRKLSTATTQQLQLQLAFVIGNPAVANVHNFLIQEMQRQVDAGNEAYGFRRYWLRQDDYYYVFQMYSRPKPIPEG